MVDLARHDIQGNVLEGYGYAHGRHLFCRFRGPTQARRALAGLLGVADATHSPMRAGRETVFNLALSHAGLAEVLADKHKLSAFPTAFKQGMEARHRILGDDPTGWASMWRGRAVHLWVCVHGLTHDKVKRRVDDLEVQLRPEAEILDNLEGHALEPDGYRIEHFGFRDGLSNPSVAGAKNENRPGGGTPRRGGGWAPLATGEFLLGHQDESGEVAGAYAPDLTLNGSFAVFRVLAQNVAAFRAYVQTVATELGQDAEFIAARMVGRHRDGTPLVPATPSKVGNSDNEFTFKDDLAGSACPLGSHVRRANLREATGFPELVARHRIIRRGMPYGELLPDPPTPEQVKEGRGLLFVCMNASIERQFEFVQQRWLNDGASVNQGGDPDPLMAPREGTSKFIIQGDAVSQRAPVICTNLPPFVECLGGEYFFMPGIAALRRLSETPSSVRGAA